MKKYYCLQPAMFRLDGGAMYGIIPKPLWQKNSPPDEQNRIDLALRLLVIESDNQLVVVDTGIGDYHGHTFDERFDVRSDKDPLSSALAKIDKKPQDVTDLILSHLHFDHVGGLNIDRGNGMEFVFPNAHLHIHKQHYEYSLNPTARDSGSFHIDTYRPIIDKLDKESKVSWYRGEEGEIISNLGINFKCSHGHTPFLMHPYDEKYIYLADLIPTSNHVKIPWVMGYDIYPGQTVQDKEKFLHFIAEKGLKVIYEHDPVYWGSSLVLDSKGRIVIGENFDASLEKAISLDK